MSALAPLLIVGAGGMLGSHLCEAAAARGLAVIAASSRGGAASHLDLLSDDAGRWLDALPEMPAAALVCSAQSNIDTCRRDPEGSWRLNVEATGALFRALAERGVATLYYSSDMVFAGDAGNYGEDDECRPSTEYGRQKRAAEEALLAAHPRALVLRLGKLYARDRRDSSPLSGWFRSWSQGRVTRCARDQWLMPTWAGDVAAISLDLIARQSHGVLHVVAPAAYTRLELARRLARVWGFDEGLIVSCSIADFDFAEPRPLNNCLRSERLRAWLAPKYFPVERLEFAAAGLETPQGEM